MATHTVVVKIDASHLLRSLRRIDVQMNRLQRLPADPWARGGTVTWAPRWPRVWLLGWSADAHYR